MRRFALPVSLSLLLAGCVHPQVVAPVSSQRLHAARMRRAAALLDLPRSSDGRFLGNSGRLLFRSVSGGPASLWLREVNGTERRLSPDGMNVEGAAATPDGTAVLLLAEANGSENSALFRLNPDTSELTPLSEDAPGHALQRDLPAIPRERPAVALYTARAQETGNTALWIQPIAGVMPRQVAALPVGTALWDVDPRGTRALVIQQRTYSDSTLSLVDLQTGALRVLAPAPGQRAFVSAAAFSRDGASIFLATDEGGETTHLVRLSATGAIEAEAPLSAFPTGTVSNLFALPDGRTLAITIDAGSRNALCTVPLADLRSVRELPLPPGVGGFDDVSDTGALLLTWSTANAPDQVFRTTAQRLDPRPIRNAASGPLVVRTELGSVRSFDGVSIPVNVYLPAHAVGPLPSVVFLHGGPPGVATVGFSPRVRFFVEQGFAVVEPNIRGSSRFGRAFQLADDREKRPDSFRDLDAVGRWVRAQPWADPSRVAVQGHSYGGYLALVALTRYPELWRAGIDMSGISEWRSLLATTTAEVRSHFDEEVGTVERDGALLDRLSPLNDVAHLRAPLLVVHGAQDTRVPRAQAEQLVEGARRAGANVTLWMPGNEGHVFVQRENQLEFLVRPVEFLEQAFHSPGKDSSATPAVP